MDVHVRVMAVVHAAQEEEEEEEGESQRARMCRRNRRLQRACRCEEGEEELMERLCAAMDEERC